MNFTSLANVAVPIEQVSEDIRYVANSFSNFGPKITEPLENSPTIFEEVTQRLGI